MKKNKGLDFIIDTIAALKLINSQMKNKLKELDVDFIGGQRPLTKEEEFAISTFIRLQKEKRRSKKIPKIKGLQKSGQPALN